jgi:tight adherence protein B
VNEWVGLLLVFGAVMAVAYGVLAAVEGAGARRFRTRLDALTDSNETEQSVSAIRARYLRQLSPFERRLEQLPAIEMLGILVEQAGWTVPAYRVAMLSVILAGIAAVVAVLFTRNPLFLAAAAIGGGWLPWLKARADREKRLEQFEAQLPDALDLMSRSLRAGNPLMESFKFVADEMKPPISTDFGRAWSNVNYGVTLKVSLADLIERTPSVSLRSLSTAILVQRETGGNLAEILDKITHVLRARAKFQRRLKTLTAEGRMSGWILGSLPPALAGLMSITSPAYLPMLLTDPGGKKLITGSLILMAFGIFWISRIVKIRV